MIEVQDRAAILWVGRVYTDADGFSPVVEGWGFDSYAGSPTFDSKRHVVCGWPIHELAAMAALHAAKTRETA